MQVSEAIEDYRYAILEHTKKSQAMSKQRLLDFAAWCEEHGIETIEKIKASDVAKFIETVRNRPSLYTGKPLSTYTVHGYASTVKAFLNWAAKEELVSRTLPSRLKMPKVEQKVIETFTDEQIKTLLHVCEKEKDIALEVRDRASLSVLLDTGIRAGRRAT